MNKDIESTNPASKELENEQQELNGKRPVNPETTRAAVTRGIKEPAIDPLRVLPRHQSKL
jgi:hypothetical protein